MTVKTITYKINQAKSDDILKHLRNCNDSFIPPLDQKVNIDNYSQKLFENAKTFEAWSENELVGLIAVYCSEINKRGFITNVSVTEKFSNQGVASELLKSCIKYFESKQLKELVLEVHPQNEKAKRLYEKFNFQEVEPNNDIILMRREI